MSATKLNYYILAAYVKVSFIDDLWILVHYQTPDRAKNEVSFNSQMRFLQIIL